jgi:predicted Rossmann-fold nucleotide-binding protein
MDFAINRFFEIDDSGFPKAKKIVVIMGSHSILRSDSRYAKIALLARTLSKAGYFIVTGGGPGLMEAAHLGAYLSGEPDGVLQWALQTLSLTSKPVAGSNQRQYEMADFWTRSQEVIKQYPHGQESLGIPTWFYGHEGANAFSTHIAKYFSNALREEKICSIGFHGAIFADGGPGTFQEISMVAAENGYASYNWYKPMVIFSEKPEAQLMKTLIVATTTPAFKSLEMLTLTSDIDSTVEFIRGHPPAHKNEHLPLSRGHLRQPSRQ